MERWHYCAVRDEPDKPCAWPHCTCGKGSDPGEPPAPEEMDTTERLNLKHAFKQRAVASWGKDT